ncbi:MAG: response regulator, partial [Planctomycetota bacterium]|nr:response regulator [Planctomycetota bacterium]
MTRAAVLVIDDDDTYRELVCLLMEDMGVAALQAATCRAGLELLAQERGRVRLVLVDYFMPGMEPARCVAEVRRAAASGAWVVLVTAAEDPQARAEAVGLPRWLAKPFG